MIYYLHETKLKCLPVFFLIAILTITILSCSLFGPAKPNIPLAGSYSEKLNQLKYENPLLAEELKKLPELQDGISDAESKAIEKLLDLYFQETESFNSSFELMYQIGKPEVRKYCTPLQALFWMAEDNNILINDHVSEYSLAKLLENAWKQMFSNNQLLQIIEGTKSERIKNKIIQYNQNGDLEGATEYILRKYNNRPESFKMSAKQIIFNGPPRWNDPKAIIDRLNAPELLDFYINRNIEYKFVIGCVHRSPSRIIKYRYGDCDDLAYFGKKALSKSGYDVFGRIVGDRNISCHIGLVIRFEDESYVLAVDFRSDSHNHMSGPYKTLLEVDQSLGYGSRYRQRGRFNFHWMKN